MDRAAHQNDLRDARGDQDQATGCLRENDDG